MYKFEASAGTVLLSAGRHALTLLFLVMGWGKPGECAALCDYLTRLAGVAALLETLPAHWRLRDAFHDPNGPEHP
ncbi:hypothetical protein JUN65_11710 [Gluconacetobacter azotocaptans]|uniref:hypothetical protein n=1 Tax=Gluconacetobacter azotocaptans TaxID=142834 RepID=UPI001958C722|nr:hypothetical protein [Gluconacetobacter azotocaptans]MBM9402248.1 hypothetical protein [Gluconacetobacter azotocaptans]